MNCTQLIFGDPVRPAKIIWHRSLGRVIVLRRVAEISEYIINLFLGKDAVRHLSIYRTEGAFLYLRIMGINPGLKIVSW